MPNALLQQLATTRHASAQIRLATSEQKTALLMELATAVEQAEAAIISANALDLTQMPDADPKKDRLRLDAKRIADLAASIRAVALLPDPGGQVLAERILPNGLRLRKISVPLGVVGVIYESRPNVTLDVTALCLRSGNAAVLRGGTDAFQTNTALVQIIHEVLARSGFSTDLVALLPTDRALVTTMLTANQYLDLVIPRGSDSLIRFVRDHATVPVIETGAGVCHTYVHHTAQLEQAAAIIVNAKVSRPSVCNALDTILADASVAQALVGHLAPELARWQVEVYADTASYGYWSAVDYPYLKAATEADFGHEYLSLGCSMRVVADISEALEHIAAYSSRHSEAIVTQDAASADLFVEMVDAAAVYVNASTRFTDGGEFGLGAEIGISTQKLHARGPFALEKLVTEKWIIRGEGQVRW
jgi:glutamate-5-semialdehyde dehydrogenase